MRSERKAYHVGPSELYAGVKGSCTHMCGSDIIAAPATHTAKASKIESQEDRVKMALLGSRDSVVLEGSAYR